MVKFTCHGCKEEFRISETNLKAKESISCPNCAQQLNPEMLKNLVSYAESVIEANKYFAKAKEYTSDDNTKNSGVDRGISVAYRKSIEGRLGGYIDIYLKIIKQLTADRTLPYILLYCSY